MVHLANVVVVVVDVVGCLLIEEYRVASDQCTMKKQLRRLIYNDEAKEATTWMAAAMTAATTKKRMTRI
jgi:hypothetical protein